LLYWGGAAPPPAPPPPPPLNRLGQALQWWREICPARVRGSWSRVFRRDRDFVMFTRCHPVMQPLPCSPCRARRPPLDVRLRFLGWKGCAPLQPGSPGSCSSPPQSRGTCVLLRLTRLGVQGQQVLLGSGFKCENRACSSAVTAASSWAASSERGSTMGALPAAPLASPSTVSLVLVSPSTVICVCV